MKKVFLWVVAVVVAVPVAVITYSIFMLYIFYPAKHQFNVYRMDANNDHLWEEAVARIVTVEAELGTTEIVETLKTDVICYEGYFAKPWDLKTGPPKTGLAARSIGFETLQANFPTGAILDINLRTLCATVFRKGSKELPLKIYYDMINIVAPDISLYCRFQVNSLSEEYAGKYALYTDAGWVSHPYIVAIEEQPLKSIATRADMGSSETPKRHSAFNRRWKGALGTGRHRYWKAEQACWTDQLGHCNEMLTNYCGRNPK